MIEIELGRFYARNKTARYILPIVDAYSNEFKYQWRNVNPGLLASAIGDVKYDKAKGRQVDYALFMLYDINGAFDVNSREYKDTLLGRTMFNSFLKFCRKYTHYIDDYYFTGFQQGSRISQQHLCCVITAIPKRYHGAYDNFLKGAYSKMFSSDDLQSLFITPKRADGKTNPIWSILTKDKEYRKQFEAVVNETFNTNVTIADDRELDFPLRMEDEKLNWDTNRV